MAERGGLIQVMPFVSGAGPNQLCAYVSVALLAGLFANALAGW